METYRGTVYPYQLDHMGHMNVQWYTAKFDEATWHFFASIGISPDYVKREDRGMAAVEQNTRYKSEVMAGDLLVVTTALLEVRDKTLRFLHTMRSAVDGREIATTELTAVHLDLTKRKACSFPQTIRDAASAIAE